MSLARDGARAASLGTDAPAREAEAVRYRLLGRIAGSMRHAVAGEIQALQFSVELALRAAGAQADPRLAQSLGQLRRQTQAVSSACRAVLERLQPDEAASVPVAEALEQCMHLAGDDWPLRGIEGRARCATGDARVARAAFVELVVAALCAVTEGMRTGADVSVEARLEAGRVVVEVRSCTAQRDGEAVVAPVATRVLPRDVEALARERRIDCTATAERIVLALDAVAA